MENNIKKNFGRNGRADTRKAEEMKSREREKYLGQFHTKTAKKIAEAHQTKRKLYK